MYKFYRPRAPRFELDAGAGVISLVCSQGPGPNPVVPGCVTPPLPIKDRARRAKFTLGTLPRPPRSRAQDPVPNDNCLLITPHTGWASAARQHVLHDTRLRGHYKPISRKTYHNAAVPDGSTLQTFPMQYSPAKSMAVPILRNA
jgi:hypothetical protein